LGADFLAGAGYYASGYAPNPLPVLPNLTLFAALLGNNPLIVLFIGIGIVSGFVFVIGIDLMMLSRIFFAYSFDRVVPKFMADVSRRFRTPVKSLLICAVGGEIMLLVLSGVVGPSTASLAFLLYTYAGLGTIGFLFTLTSLSGIIFPYKNKSFYEQACPVKRKIAGVPIITWLGIIALVYSVGAIGYYSYDYTWYLGAGTLAANLYFPFLGVMVVLFLACIVWYFAVSRYRSKSGLPFQKAFQEIPPE